MKEKNGTFERIIEILKNHGANKKSEVVLNEFENLDCTRRSITIGDFYFAAEVFEKGNEKSTCAAGENYFLERWEDEMLIFEMQKAF